MQHIARLMVFAFVKIEESSMCNLHLLVLNGSVSRLECIEEIEADSD
jgi:hypothetical protein